MNLARRDERRRQCQRSARVENFASTLTALLLSRGWEVRVLLKKLMDQYEDALDADSYQEEKQRKAA